MTTIKTLRLKTAPTQAPQPAAEAAPEAPPPQTAPPGLEAGSGAAMVTAGKSRKALLWLTLGVIGCAVAIIALQYTEFSFYSAPPSVWPLK